MSIGNVALVGAGCGGIEWLTLQGLSLVRACDAIVYDDLIDPAILAEAPAGARRVAMGKRCGRESAAQGDIEATLVGLAMEGLNVVRLKGGDPFIFGRGGEELIALNKAGIPWTVVPGISSSIAVPMEAGIPVTHRAVSRSVHIITAHTKEDRGPENIETLAQLKGTLVFLMGLGALEGIARDLVKYGKSAETPACVLSGGNSTHPARVIGTLADISEKAKAAGVVSPAVILVGEVAALEIYENANRPLSGMCVGLTGTDPFRRKVRGALTYTGARCIDMMSAAVSLTADEIPWNTIAEPEAYIAFTSGQGVNAFFDRALAEGFDLRRLSRCRFAVIGEATCEALKKRGFIADLIAPEATSESLADELTAALKRGSRVFTAVSRKGSDTLERKLTTAGISVCRTDVYDVEYTCTNGIAPPDVIIFGSAGGVKSLYESGYTPDSNTRCLCIGPVCANAIRKLYKLEPVIAESISVEGIVHTLINNR